MSDFVLPVTRYALSGEVNIAYQTMGDGPVDIIHGPGANFARRIRPRVPRLYGLFAPSFDIRPRRYIRQERARIVRSRIRRSGA